MILVGRRPKTAYRVPPLRTESAEYQFTGREAERVVGILYPYLGMLNTVIHNHIHYDSGSRGDCARALACSIDFVSLNQTPFSARAPVPVEISKRVLSDRLAVGMLL